MISRQDCTFLQSGFGDPAIYAMERDALARETNVTVSAGSFPNVEATTTNANTVNGVRFTVPVHITLQSASLSVALAYLGLVRSTRAVH